MHHAVGSTQLNVSGVQLQPRSEVSCRMTSDVRASLPPNAPHERADDPARSLALLPSDAH